MLVIWPNAWKPLPTGEFEVASWDQVYRGGHRLLAGHDEIVCFPPDGTLPPTPEHRIEEVRGYFKAITCNGSGSMTLFVPPQDGDPSPLLTFRMASTVWSVGIGSLPQLKSRAKEKQEPLEEDLEFPETPIPEALRRHLLHHGRGFCRVPCELDYQTAANSERMPLLFAQKDLGDGGPGVWCWPDAGRLAMLPFDGKRPDDASLGVLLAVARDARSWAGHSSMEGGAEREARHDRDPRRETDSPATCAEPKTPESRDPKPIAEVEIDHALVNAFELDEDQWRVSYNGRTIRLRVSEAMSTLVNVIAKPGEEHDPFALAGRVPPGSKPQQTMDGQSRRALRRKSEELSARIESLRGAGEPNALGEIEELEGEHTKIQEHLNAATSSGRRSRDLDKSRRRARDAVAKRIKRAIDGIRAKDPDLAGHLDNSVSTAPFRYLPDANHAQWRIVGI